MDVCKIEIDFGRQSFRVLRRPFLQPTKSAELTKGSKYTDRLEKVCSDQSLPIFDKNRPPPIKRPSNLDKIHAIPFDVCKESKEGKEGREMAEGGILTSIHIPGRPDNNFDKVFNSMLPEDIVEKRRRNCTCHKRTHPDVDMNKMMFDLVNSINKGHTKDKTDDDREASSNAPTKRESFFRRRSTFSFLRTSTPDFNFWIGSEYKYDVYQNKLILKFVLIGQVPDDGNQMFIDVHVHGGIKENRKQVKLERIGRQNEIGKEVAVEMVSFLRTLEEHVNVRLNVKRGFLRKPKSIDEWQFSLDDCHCLHPRSFWKNVKN